MEEKHFPFLDILDEKTKDVYNQLMKIEDETIFHLEIVNIEKRLKKVMRKIQLENDKEGIYSTINYLLYRINCLFTTKRSLELEDTLQLAHKSYKMEKECLKLLKKSLLYVSKNPVEPSYHTTVTSIFLSILVLNKLEMNRDYHRKQQYKKVTSYQKDISAIFPKEHQMNLEDNTKMVEKIKQYAARLPRN